MKPKTKLTILLALAAVGCRCWLGHASATNSTSKAEAAVKEWNAIPSDAKKLWERWFKLGAAVGIKMALADTNGVPLAQMPDASWRWFTNYMATPNAPDQRPAE